jgi:hypothetical protein
LREVITALQSMNSTEITAAADGVESMLAWPVQELQAHLQDLRQAADLARSSSELWGGLCQQAALDTAGYSALGVPAEAEACTTGGLRG